MSELLILTSKTKEEDVIERLQKNDVIVGKIYRNKKSLYEELDCDYTKGIQQNNRDRVLKRFINWERLDEKSREIVITEVYKTPLPKLKRGRTAKDKLEKEVENTEKYRENQYNHLVAYGIGKLIMFKYKDKLKGQDNFTIGTFKENLSHGLGLLPCDFYCLTKSFVKREEIIRSILPENWVATKQEILMIVSGAKQVSKRYCEAGIKKLVEEGIITTSKVQVYLDNDGIWQILNEDEIEKDREIKEKVGKQSHWERDMLTYEMPMTLIAQDNYQTFIAKEAKEQKDTKSPRSYYATLLHVDSKKLVDFVENFQIKGRKKELLQISYRATLLRYLDAARIRRNIKKEQDFEFLSVIPENIITNNFLDTINMVCNYWYEVGFAGKSSPRIGEKVHPNFFEIGK